MGADIKSNNPHLTGGEKTLQAPGLHLLCPTLPMEYLMAGHCILLLLLAESPAA